MKARMPNRKILRLLNSDPTRRTAFNHLHRLFHSYCFSRRQENMQTVGHEHKSMQLVKSAISATDNLFRYNIGQGYVDEEWMLLPGISCDKVNSSLMYPPRNPSHIRTLRG
jgi:hypothetical protein